MKPDPDAFAALLCDWCLEAKEGQQVLVVSTTLAHEPVRALHRALLERGAWPLLRLSPPGLGSDFYRYAHDEQLDGYRAAGTDRGGERRRLAADRRAH